MDDERRADRQYFRCGEEWSVREDQLHEIHAEKVFGVLAGPSSCGCEPSGFRWVTESEVKAGWADSRFCPLCEPNPRRQGFPNKLAIIDVMGEADTARETYEAEFMGKHEGATG